MFGETVQEGVFSAETRGADIIAAKLGGEPQSRVVFTGTVKNCWIKYNL